MEDLVKYIVPLYSLNWRALGTLLHVHTEKLNDIAKEKKTNQEQCKEVLKEWLSSDIEPSWGKLLDVVKSLPVITVS